MAARADGKVRVVVPARLVVNTMEATIAAAEAGIGLAKVLSFQAKAEITKGSLVAVSNDHAPPPMPVSLLYDADRGTMPALRAFNDTMQERASNGAWG